MKRVLLLGAGLVAKPLIDELLDRRRGEPVEIEIGTLDVERAEGLIGDRTDRARAVPLDVADTERLSARTAAADAVVSLLPAPLHPQVARACLRHRKPLVTTSYVSDEMRALDPEARERDVLLLNECGLDPGIDHLMAVDGIRQVEREGGTVKGYSSCAGGLPAPESNDNPWGYKLSWSPRGVLIAARSPVRFLEDGRVIEGASPFEPGVLERLPTTRLEVTEVGSLEVYPNRDSLPYRELYGLADATSIFRGTLRHPGWCETCRALLELDLLSTEPEDLTGDTWAGLLAGRLDDISKGDGTIPGEGDLARAVAEALGLPREHPVLERLAWLGLFTDEPLPEGAETPLDALAARMTERMSYRPGERDLIVLIHHFTAEGGGDGGGDDDRGPRRLESRLRVTGEAGDESAMARTVGVPAALACRRILEGRVALRGVQIPTAPELVDPLLAGLAERGLAIEHREL